MAPQTQTQTQRREMIEIQMTIQGVRYPECVDVNVDRMATEIFANWGVEDIDEWLWEVRSALVKALQIKG